MAKKKTNTEDMGEDMDFGEMGDLGDDMSFGDDEELSMDRKPTRSEVGKELVKEAGGSLVQTLIQETAQKALPEEYTTSYYQAMDLVDVGADAITKNKQKLSKSVYRLGKEAKKILPFKIGALDRYLEEQESEHETTRQVSEEEMRNSSIGAELGSIFDKQLEITKALEAKREADDEVETKQRLTTTKLNLDVLGSIDAHVGTSAAFTMQVSKFYYKKSLELQFKSYFVQADMLKTMRDHYKGFGIQFSNIEKNTALPEFAKLQDTERLAEHMKSQGAKVVHKAIFDGNRYMEGVKKKLSRYVDEKTSAVTNKIDSVTGLAQTVNSAGEMGGSSPLQLLATIGSGLLGSTAGEKISEKISPRLKEKFENSDRMKAGAGYLKAFTDSPATFFQAMREKLQGNADENADESTMGRWLKSKASRVGVDVLGVTRTEKQETKIQSKGYLDHGKPAIFDNNVHRSITETIPMYLSNILQQNTSMVNLYKLVNPSARKGAKEEDRLVYDFGKRNLTTQKELTANMQDSVFEEKNKKHVFKNVSNVMLKGAAEKSSKDTEASSTAKNANKKLLTDKASQELLASYLQKASGEDGMSMDYDTLVTNYQTNPTLESLVREDPKLKTLLEGLKKYGQADNAYVKSTLSDSVRKYPIEPVKMAFSNVSRLGRKGQPNIIKDATAEVIAKAFTSFQLYRNEDITPQKVTDRTAFLHLTQDKLNDDVKRAIGIFISDVARLQATDDTVINGSLYAIFAALNSGLRNNSITGVDVLQSLAELNPALAGKAGKSTEQSIERLVEGDLSARGDANYVNLADLKGLGKLKRKDLDQARDDQAQDTLMERMSKRATAGAKEMAEALKATRGNPAKIAELAVQSSKKLKTTVTEKLTKSSKELTTKLDGLATAVKIKASGLTKVALGAMVVKTEDLIAQLDAQIALEKEDLRQRKQALDALIAEIGEAYGEDAGKTSAIRSQKAFEALAKANLSALNNVRTALEKQKSAIQELMASDDLGKTLGVKKLKEIIATTVASAKTTLKELEDKGRAERARMDA